ncbi:unnamed protein product [Rotaria sordida]|uniref:Uncharacterized protein n=1 Tax=Rotaria sordida TaxID=392033 RepID=A0A815IWF3_9BILA|nr:unnamed protein product [Rotaria sordida]
MPTVNGTSIQLINDTPVDSPSLNDQSDSQNTLALRSIKRVTIDSNVSNDKEIQPENVKQYRSVGNISFAKISLRLTKRKILLKQLCIVTDIMCVLGILGIILMIIENELTFSQINNNNTISSWSIKVVISLSTVVLIGFVVQYHHLDLSLYAVNNSIADYRVAITYQKILLIVLEILVCAVHPMPRSFPRHSNPSVENINSNSSTFNRYPLSYISVDVALGFPMFARVYLLCRFVMFHSHVFHDISSRSVGYLNKISIDYVFLIKAYLQQYPVSCLTTVCIIVFFIGSWCTRACDYTPTNEHVSMPQAMWFFIVTFTTIGYGDFTPSTYCGRAIATIIGLYGILVAALLITVLTQKLLLNRWEKYVHSFVLNVEFAKNRKIQAANVIKFAFQAWYLKKKNTSEFSIQHLRAQQRLFQSIRSLHEIKQKQGQQVDNCVDQIDIISVQRNTSAEIYEISEQLKIMKTLVLDPIFSKARIPT